MKKIISSKFIVRLLSMALAVGIFSFMPLQTRAEEPATGTTGLQAVTNLRWSDTTPGTVIFYNPNEGNLLFAVRLYKDGNECDTITYIGHWSPGDVSLGVPNDIEESGSYTYEVGVFDSGVEPELNLSNGYVSELSPVFNYTSPAEQVAVANNIKWDSTGRIGWDKVEHAGYYTSSLYVKDSSADNGYRFIAGHGTMHYVHDYADKLVDGYEYYVRIKAYSNNINSYAHGDWTEYIPLDKNNEYIPPDKNNENISSDKDNVNENGGTGDTYYDATEDISNALAQATEEMIRIEEAIPVTAFFSAEAVNALPTEVKENVATNNTIYNLSKITTTQGFISAVDKIIKSDQTTETVTFYSSKPFAFNAQSLTALTNADRGFVYMFNHQGHLYKITIPAGAKVDLAGQSFAGPLYIGAQLGTSVLVK